VDAEIGENLAAKSDLSQNALVMAIFFVRASLARGANFTVKDNTVRLDGAIDVESATGVVEVNEGAASRVRNLAERLLNETLAIAY
jgi:hypothetical protein